MPGILRPDVIYRHLNRYRQVAQVLAKHGFGQVVDQLRLWEELSLRRCGPRKSGKKGSAPHTLAERTRLALEDLGPTFIKLGQMLSTRPDLVPREYVVELEKLQNCVAPVAKEPAMKVLRAELGKPVEEVFASLEEEPIAAASLSQVYRAVLKSGETVAVKVQRPGIHDIIRVDLEIMHDMATRLDRYMKQPRAIDLTALVDELSSDMKRELNFITEANNMSHFARNMAEDAHIHVPAVYKELCTPRLLVIEFIEGIIISETERLDAEGYDKPLIAQRGADMYLKSILEDGFFHADPHPGNILVLPDNELGLLDFGMIGRLSSNDRDLLVELFGSIFQRDSKGLTRTLLEMSGQPAIPDPEQLEMEISHLVEDYVYLSLKELQLGDFFGQLLHVARTYNLRLPRHYIWLVKVIVTVESTGRRLDENFNLVEYARPYVQRLVVHRLNPLRRLREFRLTALDLIKLMKDLPYEFRNILRQVRAGQVKLEIEHTGLEPMRLTLNRITNRIVLVLIISALLVGSSIIVHSSLPPMVSNIPVIGLSGFIITALLAIWLIISILRSGHR